MKYCCFRAGIKTQAHIPSFVYFSSDKSVSWNLLFSKILILELEVYWCLQIYHKAKKMELYITHWQLISLSSMVLLGTSTSYRHIIRRIFNWWKSAGIFNNFVNTRGAGPRPKKRQMNSCRYLTKEISHISRIFCLMGHKNKYPSNPACMFQHILAYSSILVTFLRQCKPSLKCWYGMNWFNCFKFITGLWFPSFFRAKNNVLRYWSFCW